MVTPETYGKTSMLERVIEMIVAIVAARAMSNPVAVRSDVRRVGITVAVRQLAVVPVRFRPAVKGTRPTAGNKPAAKHMATPAVCARHLSTAMTSASASLGKRGDDTCTP